MQIKGKNEFCLRVWDGKCRTEECWSRPLVWLPFKAEIERISGVLSSAADETDVVEVISDGGKVLKLIGSDANGARAPHMTWNKRDFEIRSFGRKSSCESWQPWVMWRWTRCCIKHYLSAVVEPTNLKVLPSSPPRGVFCRRKILGEYKKKDKCGSVFLGIEWANS